MLKRSDAPDDQEGSRTSFESRLAQILAGPQFPTKMLVAPRASFAMVYAQARALHAALQMGPPDLPVVLFTTDRPLVAAALLAAAAGGPPLVIPYALSPAALAEVKQAMHTERIITDRVADDLQGLQPVTADPSPAAHPDLRPAPCDRTMVFLFTGGSTGKPKIWPKTARNLFGEACLLCQQFQFTANDRILATAVPYHIYGLLFSILVPLVASAGIVSGIPTYPQEIGRGLDAEAATVLVSVPLHYRVLRGLTYRAPHLRLAFSSGGRLEPEDGEAFFRQVGVGVTEIYGSTETGGVARRNQSQGPATLAPFPTVDWTIRDERLWVRSDFLSPGLATDRRGFFRTGDRARRDPQGGFVLQGRDDGIVKVAGKRVDLDAVSEALKALPEVADAVVLMRRGRKGRETDIMAVVESARDAAYLLRCLAQSVETYALPRRVVVVERIPRTAAGKYDRRAIEQALAADAP
jgi:acyl-coenzyme A synthetase/AMP-(fatty) acid ligase